MPPRLEHLEHKLHPMRWPALLAATLSLFWAPAATGHETGPMGRAGLTERVGGSLPLDLVCADDQGRRVLLGNILDRPAILSLVYYSCEHICPQVLTGLGKIVSDADLVPGEDFRLITFSFDAGDTPADAAVARKNYTRPLGPSLPADKWVFLTAGEPEIARLTEAAGFSFQKDEHGFTHPVVLVILTAGGRISRYVRVSKFSYGVAYPVVFPAFETADWLRVAARGRTASGPGGPLLFCFPHEPPGQSRFFSLMTILGSITLLGLVALFIYLSAGRRHLREGP